MAITRREIVKGLLAQGIDRKEAEAQATRYLAQQDIIIVKDGKITAADPGPSIFDV